jgi:hypothetical protein
MKAFNSTEDAMAYLNGVEEEQKKNAAQGGDPRNFRFYMKYDTEANVVFLDDLLFPIREHQLKDAKGYTRFETCIEELEGECPLCDSNMRSFLGFASTVIHLDPVKKDGTKMPPTKKLIVIKQGAAKNWLRRQKEYGSLKGKVFKLYRSSDSKSPTTGSDIEYKKDADWEKAKKMAPEGVDANEWIKPYDYKELFKPKSVQELRASMGISAPVGSEEADDSDLVDETKSSIDDLASQI